MSISVTPAPRRGRRPVIGLRTPRRPPEPRTLGWAALALVLFGAATAFVVITRMHPAFDAYGWLDWGRQAAHWRLDASAAPSWKPLTCLITYPYALLLGRGALGVWMVTAVAAGFTAPILGGLAARRVAQLGATGRLPGTLAAVLGAGAVIGIAGYWHFLLIAYADPLLISLTLATLLATLEQRWRLAWGLAVLLALGRPEALPALLALGGWLVWRRPEHRRSVAIGLVMIPVLWFGLPALTSSSWLIAGNVLSESTTALRGDKLAAIWHELLSLYELPMQLAVLAAVVAAAVTRRVSWLLCPLAALLWLACDVALAEQGYGIAPRYLFEPAALLVVLAAGVAAWAVAPRPGRAAGMLLRAGALGLVATLVITLAPTAQIRGRLAHNGIVLGQRWTRQLNRLHELIIRAGGIDRVLACGTPVTTIPYQSILAWELNRNVIDVGWDPVTWGQLTRHMGLPVVYFDSVYAGWHIHAEGDMLGSGRACRGLNLTTTAYG